MNLSNGFRKDVFNYFFTIIIPAIVNFFSIPLIKWLIGAESYGKYALLYGGFLVCISGACSWFTMCIVRFRSEFNDELFFYKHFIVIIRWLITISGVLSFIVILFTTKNILFSSLYTVCLIGAILQNSIIAVAQSNFQSRYTLFSEAIRAISFVTSYLILFFFSTNFFLEKLFISLLLSYCFSILYLKAKIQISISQIRKFTSVQKFPYNAVINFGIPLILWFLFASVIPYADKLLIAKKFDNTTQGNYQAIFDIIYRAVGMLFAPVITAAFPYLSKWYTEGKRLETISLLKKIVLGQLLAMLLTLAIYSLGCYKLLFSLLSVPDNPLFFWTGFVILFVAFVWQVAMVLHKPLELMKKTNLMLVNNFAALFATLIPLLIIYNTSLGLTAYPIGIFIGGTCYSILSILQIKRLNFSK